MKNSLQIGFKIVGILLLSILVIGEMHFSADSTICEKTFEIEEEENVETSIVKHHNQTENIGGGSDNPEYINLPDFKLKQHCFRFSFSSNIPKNNQERNGTDKVPFYIINCSLVVYS